MENNPLKRTLIDGIIHNLQVQYVEYDQMDTSIDMSNISWIMVFNPKPYLRQISDLCQTITQGNQTFIPINFLALKYADVAIENILWDVIQNPLLVNEIPYFLHVELLSFHFNVYGLSEDEYVKVNNKDNRY